MAGVSKDGDLGYRIDNEGLGLHWECVQLKRVIMAL